MTISSVTPTELSHEVNRHYKAGNFRRADELLKAALAKYPREPSLWNMRGIVFAGMQRHIDAIWAYRTSLSINPDASDAWTNLGNALAKLRQSKSAIVCHQRAIALADERSALLYHNLGAALCAARKYDDAVAAFSRALDIDPNFHVARWDRALSYLYLGDLKRGWIDYEIRLSSGQLPKRTVNGQYWDGTPYPGKRLVLLSEQGFGDALWVARYFKMVKSLGGELIVECRKELAPLFEAMQLADRIIVRGSQLPDADLYCYICSLPGLFTKTIESIPNVTYLTASDARTKKIRSLIKPSCGLKVGIVWSGSVTFGNNRDRAHTLMRFLQSFAFPGVQLYSLQKGRPEDELKAIPVGFPIIDLSPHLGDFSDTAAALAALDLVIMTDSAVAHLGGAMGKPVWVLLGPSSHWLWLADRNDSPWYPSLRLIRSRDGRDWDEVFDSAAASLMQLAFRSGTEGDLRVPSG